MSSPLKHSDIRCFLNHNALRLFGLLEIRVRSCNFVKVFYASWSMVANYMCYNNASWMASKYRVNVIE